jgi:hypothetical protein
MNTRRLKAAIKFMRSVPRKHFDMGAWALSRNGGGFSEHGIKCNDVLTKKYLHTCGTTACAAGWLATSPAWRKAGVELRAGEFSANINDDAIRRYLDINCGQFTELFLGGGWVDTPKQWARMAEKFMKEWVVRYE